MRTQVPPRHPLRQLFGALIEKSFTEHLGWPDANVTKYVSDLLVDFTHTDHLYKIRNQQDQPVDTVLDLLFESEVLLQAQSMDRERDVHQAYRRFYALHGGTVSGISAPTQNGWVDLPQGFPRGLYEDRKALLRDCRANGRQSIKGRASSIQETFRQLRALRHRPGVCAVRSGSHERSGLSAGSESSSQLTRHRPLILAHGGAGSRRVTPAQSTCLVDALAGGYGILAQGGSALAAVECTIGLLEQSGLFNAGRGANRQLDGVQRMDAAIMEGAHLLSRSRCLDRRDRAPDFGGTHGHGRNGPCSVSRTS